jgi:hypothetical protein
MSGRSNGFDSSESQQRDNSEIRSLMEIVPNDAVDLGFLRTDDVSVLPLAGRVLVNEVAVAATGNAQGVDELAGPRVVALCRGMTVWPELPGLDISRPRAVQSSTQPCLHERLVVRAFIPNFGRIFRAFPARQTQDRRQTPLLSLVR